MSDRVAPAHHKLRRAVASEDRLLRILRLHLLYRPILARPVERRSVLHGQIQLICLSSLDIKETIEFTSASSGDHGAKTVLPISKGPLVVS